MPKTCCALGSSGDFCPNYAHSSYRDSIPGPFWSWDRFGRTSTELPDGRIIHIAGEHEDYYDPDFCIYNDVTVEHPGGRLEFYLYPKEIFPPTDFHTATLLGDDILLIGSLGYTDMRRIGETQVLRLNVTAGYDNVAFITDVAGNQLAFNDDANGSVNAQLDWTCPAGGTYAAL